MFQNQISFPHFENSIIVALLYTCPFKQGFIIESYLIWLDLSRCGKAGNIAKKKARKKGTVVGGFQDCGVSAFDKFAGNFIILFRFGTVRNLSIVRFISFFYSFILLHSFILLFGWCNGYKFRSPNQLAIWNFKKQ